MTDTATSAADREIHEGVKHLPVVGFVAIVVVYLGVIQGLNLFLTRNRDIEYASPTDVDQLWRTITAPVGTSLVLVVLVVAVLGWWRPVFVDRRPVQPWLIVVPIVMLAAIVLGTNYAGLADKDVDFVLLLLVSSLCVGFGEEIMFRGIGVTTFRTNGFTEGKVALWSTDIFGLAHATNVFAEGSKTGLQVAITIVAGYFLYLTRRRFGSVVPAAIVHALWDFGLISAGVVADENYVGAGVFFLAMFVLVVTLLIRRHHIEPTATTAPAST